MTKQNLANATTGPLRPPKGLGQTAVAAYWKQRRAADAEDSRRGFHRVSTSHPQRLEPLSSFETALFDQILRQNDRNERHKEQVDRILTALIFRSADQQARGRCTQPQP